MTYCPDAVNPLRPKSAHFKPEPVTQNRDRLATDGRKRIQDQARNA